MSTEHRTPRARHARDPVRHLQPRRSVLRRRRSRQDHHRRGDGVAGRGVRPHRGGADHRPGQATRAGARHQGSGQHAAAGAAGTRGHRRTARDDAGHAPHVRRDGGVVLPRGARRRDSGEPVLPNRRHVARGHAGVHGDGEARPAAGRGQVGPGRGGHPAVAQRARLPGCAEAARQLHGQPAVAAAARAGSRHRPSGHRRRRLGDEGAVDRSRFPNALGRSRFRAGTGCDVWLDSARRPTVPTNC